MQGRPRIGKLWSYCDEGVTLPDLPAIADELARFLGTKGDSNQRLLERLPAGLCFSGVAEEHGVGPSTR
jgi:hypothetical protein